MDSTTDMNESQRDARRSYRKGSCFGCVVAEGASRRNRMVDRHGTSRLRLGSWTASAWSLGAAVREAPRSESAPLRMCYVASVPAPASVGSWPDCITGRSRLERSPTCALSAFLRMPFCGGGSEHRVAPARDEQRSVTPASNLIHRDTNRHRDVTCRRDAVRRRIDIRADRVFRLTRS